MFVARKPGTSLEAFKDHYENKHVPLVLEVLGDACPVRHTRYYLKRAGPADGADVPPPLIFFGNPEFIDYDCITMVEFEDEAHFQRFNEVFATSPRRAEVEADQSVFADGSKFRVLAVESPKVTAR